MKRDLVGYQLVEAQVISSEDLNKALALQQTEGGRLGSILVRLGVLSEATLLEFLSQRHGVPTVELSTCALDMTLREIVPFELMQQHLLCPVRKTASRLNVAMVDPTNANLLNELRFRTGLHIMPMVATETDVRQALQKFQPSLDSSPLPLHNVRGSVDGLVAGGKGDVPGTEPPPPPQGSYAFEMPGPVRGQEGSAVEVVNTLIKQAIAMHASDIHIEPLEKILRIRFRLDGELRAVKNLPKDLHQPMMARLKILSSLDIAERRLPQDGRIKLEQFPQTDMRLALLPCLYGEKAVLRLLNQTGFALHVTNLGLNQPDLDVLTTALENPYGMILVTGPTGSGKTTTLYSALQFLNTPQMNIVTVEDPVEYQIQGINQLQIHEEIGLTFANGLRAFLRQDPDVIMVGEIRDRETAQIAVQAALTGHRVLSTLHTMNAPGAIARMIDMGIEPFLVASAVSLILGQRLIRKICNSCREPENLTLSQLHEVGFQPSDLERVTPMKGKGCVRCYQTGFSGRMAIFELLPLYEPLHALILGRASASELKTCARQEGFRTLRQAGLEAVQKGLTTVGEVLAETRPDLGG